MSSFESNAARNLPDAEAPKSGRRKKPDAIPLNDVDEVFDEQTKTWQKPDAALPALGDEDIIESYDPATGITELSPGEYEETDWSKKQRKWKETAAAQEIERSAKAIGRLKPEGEARRAAMHSEAAELEAKEQAEHQARIARLRERAPDEPSVPTPEAPVIDPKGEFITKTQAYTEIAKRMNGVNAELAGLHVAGVRGAEAREAELHEEAKMLVKALMTVQEGDVETTNGLIANPFYQEPSPAESSSDTKPSVFAETDRRAYEGMPLDRLEASVGDKVIEGLSLPELHRTSKELRKRVEEINETIEKFEQMQLGLIGSISAINESTAAAREIILAREHDALAKLLDQSTLEMERGWVAQNEAMLRQKIQQAGIPEMIQVTNDCLGKLADEKAEILSKLPLIAEYMQKRGKEFVQQEEARRDVIANAPIPLVRRKRKDSPPVDDVDQFNRAA